MICPICGKESDTVMPRERNTMYEDDDLNMLVSCLDCYKNYMACFLETWEEIYRRLLWITN